MPEPPGSEALRLQQAVAGRFVVEREIGRGGMGIVFLARDLSLSRQVAIKLLPQGAAADEECRSRFMREARTAAGLSHPNVVPIYSVEDTGDVVFFVMGYVEGETLGERVSNAGPLPVKAVTGIVRDVARALAYAHGHGVVHRDVKPDDILLEEATGHVLVTDFGIARVDDGGSLTTTGIMVGTPLYVSPEQAEGRDVDGRSDLYSLGAVAHFALTGHPPFEGENPLVVVTKHLNTSAPAVRALRPDTPEGLARAVHRCLAKDPTQRWQSGEELAEALGPEGDVVYVPPEVRSLSRTIVNTGVAVNLVLFVVLLAVGFFRDTASYVVHDIGGSYLLWLAVGFPLATLVDGIRRFLKAGFSFEDFRSAFAAEERSRREEIRAQFQPRRWDSLRAVAWRRGLGWLALAGFATTLFIPRGTGRMVVGLVTYALAMSFFVLWTSARARSTGSIPTQFSHWWLRLWTTPAASWLFRLCGKGVKRKEGTSMPSAEVTERAIARGAAEVVGKLPADIRARLRDVPDVLRRLERDADALHRRRAALDDVMGDVAGTRLGAGAAAPPAAVRSHRAAAAAELAAAQARIDGRLGRVTEALEGVRLELVRLQAGLVTIDDLAADLEAARRVSREIGAELEGRRQLSALLDGDASTDPGHRPDPSEAA